MKLLLILYDVILLLCIPFYFLFLIGKGKFSKQVFKRFAIGDRQRLAALWDKEVIWLHAVSLGEVSTCKSLIKQLSLRYPAKVIVITTVTSTGKTLAQSLATKNVVSLYMPFDVSFLIGMFIKALNPVMLILIETELWPNLLYYTQKRKISTFVLNARLSDRSYTKYQLFSWFAKRLTAGITRICVQTPLDKERFQNIGIPRDNITITGNMKFDAIEELESAQMQELAGMKERFGLELYDFLIVAGSTHPKEEEFLLDAFIQLKKERNCVRLLIAPRHLERLESIEKIIAGKRMQSERISRLGRAEKDSILLLDTIGKLRLLYGLASLVFIGGSLVPVGGHNILEPAFFAKPIIVGPHMHNFRKITQLFLSHHALMQLSGASELFLRMSELIHNNERCIELGAAAKSVVVANQGATFRNVSIITEHIV